MNANESPQRTEWMVCPECQGEGKQVNPVLSVWTEQDRLDDPESFEAMLAGRYDQVCRRCNGRTTVTVASEADWQDQERDRRTCLMESGIYPGSPDWY